MTDSDNNQLLFRPYLDIGFVLKYVQDTFGLKVEETSSIKELDSYDDRNFFITGTLIEFRPTTLRSTIEYDEKVGENLVTSDNSSCFAESENSTKAAGKYVFKVMGSRTSYGKDFLDASIAVMEHLRKTLGSAPYKYPVNIRSRNGGFEELKEFEVPLEYIAERDVAFAEKVSKREIKGDHVWRPSFGKDSQIKVNIKHYIRLLSFVEGQILKDIELNGQLCLQVGILAATFCKAMEGFTHPGLIAKRDIWDLKNLLWLNSPKYLVALNDKKKHCMVMKCFKLFQSHFLPVADNLPMQTIHSDINEGNIIVQSVGSEATVIGLIDFGDVTHSFRVFEIAISMAYISLLKPTDCLLNSGFVLSGYESKHPLTELELNVLYYCVIGRIAQSLLIGNYQYSLDPGNEYLLTTSKDGWTVLKTLLDFEDRVNELVQIWLHVQP